jgi:diguanylate cyclase (GGDEF)-like protein
MDGAGGRVRDEQVGLLMLDDFKHVNTVFEHPGGDRALELIAGCLRKSSRTGDVPAWLGGDEFAVLLRGADPHRMSALAERLLETVRLGSSVRISVGWTTGTDGGDTLLHDADTALAEAKRGGKNRALAATRT